MAFPREQPSALAADLLSIGATGWPHAPGTLVDGRYRLEHPLGRGGSGVVYEAVDEGPLQRRVALKLLHAQHRPRASAKLTLDAPAREAAQRRFLREIQVAGELQHPHLVTVFDAGLWQGQLYMVQALMTGRDLNHLLAAGPPPLEKALALAAQLCDAVAALHRASIVHLDIKPGNVLLDPEGNLKLGDFDLARVLRDGGVYPDAPRVGTPGYMSPEQEQGQRLDVRSDVFSLGCVLYLLLTGQPAFPGRSKEEISARALAGPPLPPSECRAELPPELDRVLLGALASAPEQRYGSVRQLAQELLHHAQFSQLISPTTAQKLVLPLLPMGAVTLVLGTALPLGTEGGDSKDSDSNAPGTSYTQWLIRQLQAHAPDEGLEPLPFTASAGLHELMTLLQAQTQEQGSAAVATALTEIVESLEPEGWLPLIAQLRPRLILTTRMDDGLALALTQAGVPVRRCILAEPLPDEPAGTILLVHLLGTIARPESLILDAETFWTQLAALNVGGESLYSRLATSLLLYVGMDDAFPWLQRLADVLALDRVGSPPHGIVCQSHISLETLRWSTRRGLAALESPPLAWLETLAQQGGGTEPVAASFPLPSRPYKRLDHFRAEDERIFFGRERDIRRLSSLLLARPMSLLFGASGAGKSSLVQAGLLPMLQRSGFDVLVLRPLDAPEAELAQALQPLLQTLDEGDVPARSLEEQLAQVARQTRLLVVIFDQAEELFVRHPAEARQALARLVNRALSTSGGRLRWLWCLREDFLPRMAELQVQLPTLFHNTFMLLPLTVAQARLAITEPARLLGLEVDERLTKQLLRELSGDHIESPQLQLVCDSLFDTLLPGAHRLTLQHLEQLGGVASILSDYLERLLQTLPREDRSELKRVLLALISAEGTRTPSRLEEVTLRTGLAPARVQALLETLLRLRLVRLIARDDGDWYELTHEYLTREILSWQDLRARELRRLRQLLESGLRHHQLHGLLLPPEQLKLLAGELEHLAPSDEERALVVQSRKALRRSRQTLALRGIGLVLLLVLVGLGGRYLMLRHAQFVRFAEQPLTDTRWDEHETHTVSTLRLYQGSPQSSWLDGLLGFPRPLESHTLLRADLTPDGITALTEGVVLSAGEDIQTRLQAYAMPDLPVRAKILAGRWDEAVQMSMTLMDSGRLNPEASLRLLPLLAVSGPPNRALVETALAHAERTELSRGQVQGTATGLREPLVEPYVLLLGLSPRDWWQDRLYALAQRHETQMLGLRLLAEAGDDTDAAVVKSGLADVTTRAAANWAAMQMGACSVVPTILDQPEKRLCIPDPASCLELLSDCGGPELLPRVTVYLEDLLNQPALAMSSDYLPAVFRILRRHGHNALGTVARTWRERGTTRSFNPLDLPMALGRIASLEDTSAQEFLRQSLHEPRGEARLRAALRLTRQGEVTAIPYLWQALQSRSDKSVHAALWALGQFQGPALYERLMDLTRRTADNSGFVHALMKSPHARAGLVFALEPYETPEVLRHIVSSFSDSDMAVASDAAAILLHLVERHERRGSAKAPTTGYDPRRALIGLTQSSSPPVRLRSLRVLQKIDRRPRVSEFRHALEQPMGSLSAYYEAVGGLREALALSPFDILLEALDAPDATVQRAAILAANLPPHDAELKKWEPFPSQDGRQTSPGRSLESQPRLKAAIEKARWLSANLERQSATLSLQSRWTQQGQTQPALRWINRLIVEPGTWGTVIQQVLGTTVEEDHFLRSWSRPIEADLRLKRGEQDWALNNLYFGIADQSTRVRQELLARRPLPELAPYFRYRQVMGLESARPLPPDLNWNVQ